MTIYHLVLIGETQLDYLLCVGLCDLFIFLLPIMCC